MKIDSAILIEQLKAQRNAYADAAALANAAVEQLQREVEVLSKALEVLKTAKPPVVEGA